MGSDSAISTQSLVCGYPGRTVLSGIDLEFASGTATSIIGPNGSGKSTLLKTISGLIPSISGAIRIGTTDLKQLNVQSVARKISVVPQEESIPFRFTALEVVLMARIAWSNSVFDSAEDRKAALEALEFADVTHVSERAFNELSGGERQRVLLARALAQQTDIVVLDEPTTHLDVTHQVQLCQLARRLIEQGKTIIVAMHDLNLLESISSRTVLIGDGKVVEIAEPGAILSSDNLDRVYGIRFERLQKSGRTFVVPTASV